MLVELLRNLFSSSGTGNNDRRIQKTESTSVVNKSSKPAESSKFSGDIKALEESFGVLQKGKEISLSLSQALSILPRQRRRSDAYNALIRELKDRYDVNLVVSSKPLKNNNNGKK